MADKIVYDYAAMERAVGTIGTISDNFKKAGAKFNGDFVEAINGWKGASCEKMTRLINGDVNTMLTNDIPGYITGLANLLAANIKQMKEADQQIADSIPDTLGQ